MLDTEILLILFKVILFLFFGYECFLFFKSFRTHLAFSLKVWKAITWTIIWRNALFLFIISIPLYFCRNLPIFKLSWLSVFFNKRGSLIFSSVDTNNLTSLEFVFPLLLVVLLLLFLLPQITNLEEIAFRHKKLKHKERIYNSFVFGAIHFIVGINILCILLLVFFGYYLSIIYTLSFSTYLIDPKHTLANDLENKAEKHALFIATVYHTCWNALILGIILLSLFYTIGVILYFNYF